MRPPTVGVAPEIESYQPARGADGALGRDRAAMGESRPRRKQSHETPRTV